MKMSTLFSRNVIHVLHVALRNTLIFIIVLFLALFAWLKVGVHADKFVFGQYEIDGLYIKLDKKFTLRAENIIIPKTKSKPSFQHIDRTFKSIKYVLTFFNYIELNKIHFENNQYKVIVADNTIYISNNLYEIAGNVEKVGKKLVADVSMLYIKKENIHMLGNLTYYLKKDKLETSGSFDAYNIKGNFAAKKEGNEINFAIKSNKFTDLKTLIGRVPLNKSIKSWIVDKVQAKEYQLISLLGKMNVSKTDIKMDFDSLRAKVLYKDVKIYYHEKLTPVVADSFILTYKNKGLFFDLKKPTYKGRKLDGSKVSIVNIVGGKSTVLLLDLHMKTVVDEVIQEILHAYKLHIPVTQKEALTKLYVHIDVPLGKSKQNVTVKVTADLTKGPLTIDRTTLPVVKGNVTYENGIVKINNVEIQNKWYHGNVNGNVILKKKIAELVFNAKTISVSKDKKVLFKLKNKSIPLVLNYSKDIVVDIPSFKIKIKSSLKNLVIDILKIEKIKPYLENLPIQIDGGSIHIFTKEFETFIFNGVFKRNVCFFYDKDNVCHTQVPCKGKVTPKGLILSAFNNRVNIDMPHSRIRLKNINIDLDALLKIKSKSQKNSFKKLVITGKNSNLRYKKHTLVTDSYDIEINKKGNIKAIGSKDGDIVKFTKTGKQLTIQALRVKDSVLHPLINFKGLKKGRYSLKISGDPDNEMKGRIILEGGVMSNFKVYNNTLALINTLPALATLSSPGFSQKGFKIKEGVIEFKQKKDKIVFDSIYVQGRSATIVGNGKLNLKKQTINLNLAIQTARELGKVLGNIPILGYILMGKDKSMTVGLKVTGSLNKPKVETSATQDTLTLPLRMIKRTLELPVQSFSPSTEAPKKPIRSLKPSKDPSVKLF